MDHAHTHAPAAHRSRVHACSGSYGVVHPDRRLRHSHQLAVGRFSRIAWKPVHPLVRRTRDAMSGVRHLALPHARLDQAPADELAGLVPRRDRRLPPLRRGPIGSPVAGPDTGQPPVRSRAFRRCRPGLAPIPQRRDAVLSVQKRPSIDHQVKTAVGGRLPQLRMRGLGVAKGKYPLGHAPAMLPATR